MLCSTVTKWENVGHLPYHTHTHTQAHAYTHPHTICCSLSYIHWPVICPRGWHVCLRVAETLQSGRDTPSRATRTGEISTHNTTSTTHKQRACSYTTTHYQCIHIYTEEKYRAVMQAFVCPPSIRLYCQNTFVKKAILTFMTGVKSNKVTLLK